MYADNPVSWFLLAAVGLYWAYRIIMSIIRASEERKQRFSSMEFFTESPIDKRNISVYNRYNRKGGNQS